MNPQLEELYRQKAEAEKRLNSTGIESSNLRTVCSITVRKNAGREITV